MGKANNKQDYEHVKQRVYDMYQGEYEIVTPKEDYIDTHGKIMIKHNGVKCGKCTYVTTLKSFFKGAKCVVCTTNRHNDYSFRNKIKELTGDEYKLLSKYENGDSYVDMKHNCDKCGNHIYKVRPKKFLEGKRCPACNRPNYNTNDEERRERFERERPDESFKYKSYNKSSTKIKVNHKCSDGKEYTFEQYERDTKILKCPRCGDMKAKYRDDYLFKEEIQKISDGEIVCLDTFVNVQTKLRFKHIASDCGYVWKARPSSILRGTGCPCCNESKGEKEIKKILKKYDIDFKREYIFKDLRSEKDVCLRFDFAIMDKNLQLKLLIEFDGIFHYKYVESMKNNLEYQQSNDRKKENFCKEKNIKLLRIPYWEKDNIEEILKKELNEIEEFKGVI